MTAVHFTSCLLTAIKHKRQEQRHIRYGQSVSKFTKNNCTLWVLSLFAHDDNTFRDTCTVCPSLVLFMSGSICLRVSHRSDAAVAASCIETPLSQNPNHFLLHGSTPRTEEFTARPRRPAVGREPSGSPRC